MPKHMPKRRTNTLLKITSVAILSLAGTAGTALADDTPPEDTPPEDTPPEHVAEARAAAQQLGGTLKARLVAAMKAAGPVAAITVCAEEAYGIAAQVSEDTGMDVGRSALKLRNPGNAPDAWERTVLEQFLAAQNRGENLSTLEHSETVRTGDEKVFYWAKPILLQQPCTACHGTNIAPEVTATLADYYPGDQATGFKVGELRGIFTVKKKLP